MVVPWNEVRWNFRSTAEKADICEEKGTERRSREVTAFVEPAINAGDMKQKASNDERSES